MATYLVTGGCGFIGSHLADRLIAAGHAVRILDDLSTGRRENVPPGAELEVADIVDPTAVRRAMDGVDGCFHLAAVASVTRSNEDWIGTHRINLGGTVHVLDAARRTAGGPIPVVYASSAAVYGDSQDLPLAETTAPRPLTAYGADKLGCELHARVAGLVHGVPTVGLRFFNVYGPRQDPASPYSGVISIFAARLHRREPLIVFGDGSQQRDFVYVDDVVSHLLAGMRSAAREARVFNVCTGRPTTLLALAAALGRVAGTTPVVRHEAERRGDIRMSLGSPDAAVAGLGVRAATPLHDGLGRTFTAVAR